ncbi:MAG TPA: hypothetical protein PLC42_04865 [Parachlamydiaceae bacterium]|nr:hypothetical protein [Parachlamydiaceae bacterium]
MNRKRPVINKKTAPDTSFCPHIALCSGCELSSAFEEPLLIKEAQTYFAKKGISDLKIIKGSPVKWRMRAKLAVQGDFEHPIIGLYEKGTHKALNIPFCAVHHPKINEAVYHIKEWIRQKKILPYNEKTGKGELRYIQLTVERSTQKVQVCFVLNKKEEAEKKKWLLEPASFWHSIWLNFNTKKTNTIFGPEWTHINGSPLISESLANIQCFFHPAGFMQANLDLFEALLTSIEEKFPQNQNVVEFYAGVGVIGLKVASKSKKVFCCEITEEAKICFGKAKKNLPKTVSEKLFFETGFSEKRLDLLTNTEIAIVDPPRKGVDLTLLNAFVKTASLKEIFYISCGFSSFCRDSDFLIANGWVLKSAEGYLFFPGSNHIEVFAVFTKLSTKET